MVLNSFSSFSFRGHHSDSSSISLCPLCIHVVCLSLSVFPGSCISNILLLKCLLFLLGLTCITLSAVMLLLGQTHVCFVKSVLCQMHFNSVLKSRLVQERFLRIMTVVVIYLKSDDLRYLKISTQCWRKDTNGPNQIFSFWCWFNPIYQGKKVNICTSYHLFCFGKIHKPTPLHAGPTRWIVFT